MITLTYVREFIRFAACRWYLARVYVSELYLGKRPPMASSNKREYHGVVANDVFATCITFPASLIPYFAFLSNLTFERRRRCIFTPGFRCLCDVGRVPIWTDCWLKLGVSPLLHDLLCIQLFIQRIYWSFLACQCLHRIIVRIYY